MLDGEATDSDVTVGQVRSRVRTLWLFRVGAVLLGLLPLAALEVACRVAGWGVVPEPGLAEFEAVRPLFVLNDAGDRYEVASNRLGYFRPESFAATKGSSEKRIFVLGGSTVQGRPYAVETSFTTWLELSLNAADSGFDWDVINCGGVSYASYRLRPVLDEVVDYEPDLVVIMTGHNEFLEDREFTALADRHSPSHLVRTAARLFRRENASPRPRSLLPEEVDALLDYRGGLERYSLDFAWRRAVADEFEANVRAMVERCRDIGVPLLLMRPVSNLRDSPPFKVEHDPGIARDDLSKWTLLRTASRAAADANDYGLAAQTLAEAARIDRWHAGTWFELGRFYDAAGQFESSLDAYERACDADACPLRMTSELRRRLDSVATSAKRPLLDAHQLIASRSRDGVVDSQWMLDHVHPTIAGHQLIASEVTRWMIAERFVLADVDWEKQRDADYAAHREALGTAYFTEGARRLERLTNWAQGRGEKVLSE